MKKLLYPGSFDPVTNGHLDIIKRAAALCDELVVAVFINNEKKPLFSVEERISFLKKAAGEIENVTIASFTGLLADYAEKIDAKAVIKGLRDETDYAYEKKMDRINKKLYPGFETILMFADGELDYVSSSVVKEIAGYGGNINGMVPDFIAKELIRKTNT